MAPSDSQLASGDDLGSIGSAEMKTDRTIVLQLRAESSDGLIGDGYFVYPPRHPEYDRVLEHVGPLKPGQSAHVRPWPEPKPSSSQKPGPEA